MSTSSSPTGSTSTSPTRAKADKPSQAKAICQAFFWYYSCGCRTLEPVICCQPVPRPSGHLYQCRHKRPQVLIGQKPHACGKQPARVPECTATDPAKQQYLRDIDSADRATNLLDLKKCSQKKIASLPTHVSDWASLEEQLEQLGMGGRARNLASSRWAPKADVAPGNLASSRWAPQADVAPAASAFDASKHSGDALGKFFLASMEARKREKLPQTAKESNQELSTTFSPSNISSKDESPTPISSKDESATPTPPANSKPATFDASLESGDILRKMFVDRMASRKRDEASVFREEKPAHEGTPAVASAGTSPVRVAYSDAITQCEATTMEASTQSHISVVNAGTQYQMTTVDASTQCCFSPVETAPVQTEALQVVKADGEDDCLDCFLDADSAFAIDILQAVEQAGSLGKASSWWLW